MQQPLISAQDKKDLDKFAKFLCVKAAQVIVQGRLGKSISSQCSPLPTGAEWFNLAIKDYPEIQKEAKCALMDGNPNFDSSFVVEISLRTSDSESLTLEVWSLSVIRKYEDVRIHHTVYNRMSLLLKSLMCVSRATPAYKLSRKQGSEYVICFRVYMGKVDISGLGEGFKTLRVGSIGTPTGTMMLSAAFRTAESLHVSTKKLAPGTGNPMKVSPDHFNSNSPKNATMSPARPCHTLQSQLMNSRELEFGMSPSQPLESPSYGMLPTSFSTSPGELYMAASRQKLTSDHGAMFTVGTPPTPGSIVKTSATQLSTSPLSASRRRHSDVMASREDKQVNSRRQQQQMFIHSQSEQNFSDPMRYLDTKGQRRRTVQEEPYYSQSGNIGSGIEHKVTAASVPKDHSITSKLTGDENVFKPISDDSLHEKADHTSSSLTSSTANKPHYQSSRPAVVTIRRRNRNLNIESVTTLKSSSPTNARVGFPDNAETTTHLSHIPPVRSATTTLPQVPLSMSQKSHQNQLNMPSTGAFVSNSKTATRAYNTLTGISEGQKLPFEDFITEDNSRTMDKKMQRRNKSKGAHTNSSSDTSPESGREDGSTITRLSSQSSLSSHHSSEPSPLKEHMLGQPNLADEFVMVDLNPAFGKSDSAGDLGTFYRECDNAPDLVMFKENNGEETQEALLDLTKQLEDYERDAEDFDNFAEEILALP